MSLLDLFRKDGLSEEAERKNAQALEEVKRRVTRVESQIRVLQATAALRSPKENT